MEIRKLTPEIAAVYADEALITDGAAALELIANVLYSTDCQKLVLSAELFDSRFFRLSTGFAGEVLQKFVNFGCRLAVVGDFSAYSSGPMHDFIVESNRGRHIFFAESEKHAIDLLDRD